MAIKYKDADGNTRYRKNNGEAGSSDDPDSFFQQTQSAAGAHTDIGNSTSTAAIITDTTGTVIGFLRGIVKLLITIFPVSVGQKAKTGSLSVALASDDDLFTKLDGTNSLGGVKDNGPFYTPVQQRSTSADATGGLNITTAPSINTKANILDDLVISVDTTMEVTVAEAAGVNLLSVFILANTNFPFSPTNRLRASVNKQVKVTASVAGQIRVFASWHEA